MFWMCRINARTLSARCYHFWVGGQIRNVCPKGSRLSNALWRAGLGAYFSFKIGALAGCVCRRHGHTRFSCEGVRVQLVSNSWNAEERGGVGRGFGDIVPRVFLYGVHTEGSWALPRGWEQSETPQSLPHTAGTARMAAFCTWPYTMCPWALPRSFCRKAFSGEFCFGQDATMGPSGRGAGLVLQRLSVLCRNEGVGGRESLDVLKCRLSRSYRE